MKSDTGSRRVGENAGLIFASPWLIGCSCCMMPIVLVVVLLVLSIVTASSFEVATFIQRNTKEVVVITGIGVILGIGYVLFKKYGNPTK